jgi:hypothetical protein
MTKRYTLDEDGFVVETIASKYGSKEKKCKMVVYEIGWADDTDEHVVWIRSPVPITMLPSRGEDGRNPITGLYIRETYVPPDSGAIDFEVKAK